MFASVKLLNGFGKILTYKIPKHLSQQIFIGAIVHVPLKNQHVWGFVIKQTDTLNSNISFAIKEIIKIEALPNDRHYKIFVEKAAHTYFTSAIHFYQRLQSFLSTPNKQTKIQEPTFPTKNLQKKHVITLTQEQQLVANYLTPAITKQVYAPTLVHGVTGSGKTEIYKKLITHAHAQQKSVILLHPEVSLSLQFQHLLTQQLPEITIFGFHSASKPRERKELWLALLSNKPVLILGVHLPIILPINNLGFIIIDEEHENGFQEKKHPKINSKNLALLRAHHYNIPILLGSATPSLTSLYNVKHKNWALFHLKTRFAGAFPTIQTVSLINKNKQNKLRRTYSTSFWITQELEYAIKACLARKEQAIIYLNRRGYSFFLQCKICGFIFTCKHCSVSLTLHQTKTNNNHQEPLMHLRCHYCNYTTKAQKNCPECRAPEKEFLKKGVGTQQIVQILQKLLPTATIERADLDTTKKKQNWKKTVQAFLDKKIDILVGTQTITKGYHFPSVTLVGILWADLSLHFPQFNASETTLQQIIQVAGRAGRQHQNSSVIVQVMQDHHIFNYVQEQKYLSFVKHELEQRRIFNYPPYCRLVHIEIRNTNAQQVETDAQLLGQNLETIIAKNKYDITLLGPAQPIIWKIQKIEIRQIFLKSPSFILIHKLISQSNFKTLDSSVFIVTN